MLTVFSKLFIGCLEKQKDGRLAQVSTCAYVPSDFSCVWLFATLQTVAHHASPSWDFAGKNTGVDFHALLQGIFPTKGLNPHLLRLLQVDSLLLSHQGSLHVSKRWWKQVLIELFFLLGTSVHSHNYMQFCTVIWIFTFASYCGLWGRGYYCVMTSRVF